MAKGIEPVIVELQCGLQDERARGANPCASRSNGNVIASDRTVHEAEVKATMEAKRRGWKVVEVRTNGAFRAFVCPSCLPLMGKPE